MGLNASLSFTFVGLTLLLHLRRLPLILIGLLASTWYGGFWQGMAASILIDLTINYFFQVPLHTLNFTAADLIRLLVMLVIVALASLRKRAERKVRETSQWLRTTLT